MSSAKLPKALEKRGCLKKEKKIQVFVYSLVSPCVAKPRRTGGILD